MAVGVLVVLVAVGVVVCLKKRPDPATSGVPPEQVCPAANQI